MSTPTREQLVKAVMDRFEYNATHWSDFTYWLEEEPDFVLVVAHEAISAVMDEINRASQEED